MSAVAMNYPKYDSYKASGVDWLGEIPSDWDLIPNKHIFKLKNIKVGKKSRDYDLLSLTLKGVIKRDMENPEGKFPAEFDTYQEVKKGDFIFCMFDVQETPRTVGLSKFDGMITGAYTVFDVNENYNRNFLYYFYLNLDLDKRLKPLYRGLRNTIPKEWFLNFKTFIPKFDEQTKIANFLDEKTAQIDQAIALKQQQIDKLNEYKQIVIQNAVTKGLDPNAPMKDSGVEWIGEIPQHWELTSIKRIAKISPRIDLSNRRSDSLVIFLPMEKVSSNGSIDCNLKKTLREVKQGFTGFQRNDIILAKITPCFENGKGAFLDKLETDIGYGSTEFHVLRANENIKGYYLYLITHSAMFLKYGEAMMTGSAGQKRVPTSFVANYQFPLPSIDEQQDIINHIEQLNQKFNKSVTNCQTQIDRLKEYKNVLINQAVTGKIKIDS